MLTIFVIEDNVETNDRICQKLKVSGGYAVDSFYKFSAAMAHLQSGCRPDLAIVDIVNEEMGKNRKIIKDKEAGFKIAGRLREIDPSIPIIFFTGYGEQAKIKKAALTFQPYAFLNKGGDLTNLDALIEKVNGVFQRQRNGLAMERYFEGSYSRKFSVSERDQMINNNATTYNVVDPSDIITVTFATVEERDFLDEVDDKLLRKIVKAELGYRYAGNEDKYLKIGQIIDQKCYYFTHSWISDLVNKPIVNMLLSLTTKERKSFLKEDAAKEEAYRMLIDEGVEKLRRLLAGTPTTSTGWLEIPREDEEKLHEPQSSNPYLYQEDAELYYYNRSIPRSRLTIRLKGRDQALVQKNTQLRFFEAQLQFLQSCSGETARSWCITAPQKGNTCLFSLAHVDSFTEGEVKLTTGERFPITSSTYNELLRYFPCIMTRPSDRALTNGKQIGD